MVEHEHRVPSGGPASDLDGVLDGLGPGVEQHRPLLVRPGRQAGERLAHRHVLLVRADHEAGVREVGHLRRDRGDHRGRARADRRHRDPGAEVHEPVAVDVLEDRTAGARHVHRQRGRHPGRDGGGPPRGQLD
ncbi:hypothetical protein ACVW07_003880 [Cellulomonas sp. URHB0016]